MPPKGLEEAACLLFPVLMTIVITIKSKPLALFKPLHSYRQFNFSSIFHGKKRFFLKSALL